MRRLQQKRLLAGLVCAALLSTGLGISKVGASPISNVVQGYRISIRSDDTYSPVFTVDANGAISGASLGVTGAISGSSLAVTNTITAGNNRFNVAADGTTTIGTGDSKTTIGDQSINISNGTYTTSLGVGTGKFDKGTTNLTEIDGSQITSTSTNGKTIVNGGKITVADIANGATATVEGSKVDLVKGTASTNLDAGTGEFTGADGSVTNINGGTITTKDITTDSITTNKITLGNQAGDGDIVLNSNGSADFANGAFHIDVDGSITNNIDNNSFTTSSTGSKMSYTHTIGANTVTTTTEVTNQNTARTTVTNSSTGQVSSTTVADGTITSSVKTGTVGASSTMTKDTINNTVGSSSVEIKDGDISLKNNTTGNGMSVDTSGGATDGNVTFTGKNTPYITGGATNTTINGNTITTGQITTDSLIITGKGDATGTGTGSIVLAQDGSIKSNVTDGTNITVFQTKATGTTTDVLDTNGNQTTIETTSKGTKANMVDGNGNATNTEASATGTTTTVTDGTTTGISKVTANEITNQVGSTKQSVTANSATTTVGNYTTTHDANGLNVTNDGGKTSTQVTSGDVAIKTQAGKNIKLSDLGSVDELAAELKNPTGNTTMVDGLNKENAIRQREVARLDNRIDDTNTRLDKVGAMAAAVASLRSMGYDPAAPTEFAMGVGHYSGQTGLAVGLFHYPNRDFMLNMSYTQSSGENMWGMGATWKFGRKNPDKLLNEQLKDRQEKVKTAQEKAAIAAAMAKDAEKKAAYAAKMARIAETEAATSARDTQKAYEAKETYYESQARKVK